jgi:hypothetical protein
MGRRPFIISEEEHYWRGFLYDLDCKDSASTLKYFSPGKSTAKKTDLETVIEARDAMRTVVTSNSNHFVRHTVECQKRPDNESCEDCWGLVIVPNKEFDREHALQKADIKSGVLIGNELLPWRAVGYANLCISIERGGNVHVSRFQRCRFCEGSRPLMGQSWYNALPVRKVAVRPISKSVSSPTD